MQTIKTALELNLNGNIASQCANFSRGFAGMGSTGSQSLLKLAAGADKIHGALSTVFNRTTGLLGAIGAGVSMRGVADYETRITRLRLQAEVSKNEINSLNQAIYGTSQQRDINIDPSELLSAVEKIVGKTGDLEYAQNNLKNLAYAISATGAAGEDVGAMGADLMEKFGIKESKELLATLGLLVNQGKAGAFELRDLATQGERVTAAYARTGRQGKEAVAEMGAMLQMTRKAVGSPEQAATALEALIRNLKDPTKSGILKDAGIQLTDPNDPKRMRSVIDIAKDLIKLTNGNDSIISRVIDAEGMRALTSMIIEYNQTGGFKSVDSFLNTSSDPQKLLGDSKEMAMTFNGAMTSLKTALFVFANNNLAGPIKTLADALNSIKPEDFQEYMSMGLETAKWMAIAWAGSKVLSVGAKGLSLLGGLKKGGIGGTLGTIGQLASMAKPLPVFVVNGGGKLSGMAGQVKGTSKVGGVTEGLGNLAGGSRYSGLVKWGTRLGAAGFAGMGLYNAYQGQNGKEVGAGIGQAVGAVLGTMGGPIGLLIGQYAGEKIGGYLGGLVDDFNKASTYKEKGEVVGRGLSKLTSFLPGGFLLEKYTNFVNQKAAGWIGSLFDDAPQSGDKPAFTPLSGQGRSPYTPLTSLESQALNRPASQTPIRGQAPANQKITNDIHLVIDDERLRLVRSQSSEPEQTTIDFELGNTRIPFNEA